MSFIQLRTRPQPVEAPSSAPRGGTLVDPQDRRVRYLRISLTDRCNYRCTYCMPDGDLSFGAREDVLTLEEIVELCTAFAAWGVERVRLTGGEPTIRRGVVDLIGRLARIPTHTGTLEVVMTTNGEKLPQMAEDLSAAGLRSLTVSLDSLDPARFTRITRRGNLDRVLAGIDAATAAGLGPVKLNTVAVRGFNDDELADIVRYAWDHDAVPRFIELMPMAAGELFAPGDLMPAAEIRDRVATDLGVPIVSDGGDGVRGSGPATYWRADAGPYRGRRLGTIAAMTENFCDSCNRLRISATGQLHACLARDEHGDLRGALRSGDPELLGRRVREVVGAKQDGHAFQLDGTGGPLKSMVSIGG